MKKESDKAWLEKLWIDHAGRLRAYLQRRVAAADVDDLLSEIFLVAWRHRDRKPVRSLPWLYGIGRKVVSTHHRATERRGNLAGRVLDRAQTTSHVDVPAAVEVGVALAHLNPDDREILLLLAWDGLTPSEIALVYGTSSPTMRMRLSRARRRFEAALEKAELEGARR